MKRIFIFILACLICLGLVGCANNDDTDVNMSAWYNTGHIHSLYFDSEVIEKGDSYSIIRDSNTDALYLVVYGCQQSVMTPIYNTDGTVRTYSDFCEQEDVK